MVNGNIKGVSTGTTEVTITSADGKASTTITVNVGSPLVSISARDVEMEKGQTKNVNDYLDLNPSDATNVESKTFKSSNDDIVKVDPVTGKMTALRYGTVTIIITVYDDNNKQFTATLKTTVKKKDKEDPNDKSSEDKY